MICKAELQKNKTNEKVKNSVNLASEKFAVKNDFLSIIDL